MLRVPGFPIDAYQHLMLNDIVNLDFFLNDSYYNPIFKESISIASRDLYSSMNQIPKSKKKLRNLEQSLLKYYIRASTRPTPYGLFAGVALGRFSSETELVLSNNAIIRAIKADMQWVYSFIHSLEKK